MDDSSLIADVMKGVTFDGDNVEAKPEPAPESKEVEPSDTQHEEAEAKPDSTTEDEPAPESDEVKKLRKQRNEAIRQQKRTESRYRDELDELRGQIAKLGGQRESDETGSDVAHLESIVMRAVAKQAEEAEARQLHAKVESSFDAARQEYADFDDVVEQCADIEISKDLFDAVQRSKDPGKIMYNLLENMERYEDLNRLNAKELKSEIAKIERGISTAKQKSGAPAPIKPTSSSSNRSIGDMPRRSEDVEAWLKREGILK
jgi:hypothetical protein